jgi:hypothetical protein
MVCGTPVGSRGVAELSRQPQLAELQCVLAIGKLAVGCGDRLLPQVGGLDPLCGNHGTTPEKNEE